MQIKERTFIVSGGASGLGLATAIDLLLHHGNVSILDLNPVTADEHKVFEDPLRTLFIKTDVSSSKSIHSAVQKTLQWSTSTSAPLAGVICCAGIGSPALALPRQPSPNPIKNNEVNYMSMKTFDQVLSINLRGTVDLIRLTLPHLALNEPYGDDEERGVIIAVSSISAYEGQVGQLSYSASKGAVGSIVLPLARELGQRAGIRVMGIAPGLFMTGLTMPKAEVKSGSRAKDNGGTSHGEGSKSRSKTEGGSGNRGINTEMFQYPARMGQGPEFARLVREIVENPMLNGSVIRLDGAVRMPSRL